VALPQTVSGRSTNMQSQSRSVSYTSRTPRLSREGFEFDLTGHSSLRENKNLRVNRTKTKDAAGWTAIPCSSAELCAQHTRSDAARRRHRRKRLQHAQEACHACSLTRAHRACG
jgi:hypothetical protein